MKKKKIILTVIIIILLLTTIIYLINLLTPQKNNIKESSIEISLANESIKAYTGSFCYSNGCIDKISPLEVNYDKQLVVIANEEVFLNNMENEIQEILFYNFDTKQKEDVEVLKKEKSFIVPDIQGTYIITIISKLNNKNISYSFKLKINKINYEYKNAVEKLKEDLYNHGYINNNVLDFRIMQMFEYGYYPNEPNVRYVQANLYIKCIENTTCTNNLNYYDWNDEENKNQKEGKYNYIANSIIYENTTFKEIKKIGFTPSVIQTGEIILDVTK